MHHDELSVRAGEMVARFAIDGAMVALARHGRGHIHDTFAATVRGPAGTRRYLLQRINRHVFPDPETLVHSIATVTTHLRDRLTAAGANTDGREALTLIPARDGGWLVRDAAGGAWRLYDFVEGSATRESAVEPEDARTAARGFARFLRLLSDLPASQLPETIPHFHETPRRLAAFAEILHQDPHNRAGSAQDAIARIEQAAPLARALTDLRDRGDLPVRTVHNDTKINNLLLDERTGRELCVIDLDTVMPGLALYDFGDLVRTIASATPEDEPDPSQVAARPAFVLAAAQGWIEGSAGSLLAAERARLILAARLLSFECGLRFLTDYLAGDLYFKTTRPGQNLDRCRAQLALEASLAIQEDALQGRIEEPSFAEAQP